MSDQPAGLLGRGNILVIAEDVHERDADRVLAEDWPFKDWSAPGPRCLVPAAWDGDAEDWANWHRASVRCGG